MKQDIILIDYENVQSIDLAPLIGHDVLIKVFHNENQKFSSSFTKLAIEFGKDRLELVQISGNGRNAADFHIAYFLGKLTREITNPSFHIISKDNGFRPLVDHLKNHEKIPCILESDISIIPQPKINTDKRKKDYYIEVIAFLTNAKTAKPKTWKTLQNLIVSICHNEITKDHADAIIKKLITEKIIGCTNESISYLTVAH
jgi:hypothetical protein